MDFKHVQISRGIQGAPSSHLGGQRIPDGEALEGEREAILVAESRDQTKKVGVGTSNCSHLRVIADTDSDQVGMLLLEDALDFDANRGNSRGPARAERQSLYSASEYCLGIEAQGRV